MSRAALVLVLLACGSPLRAAAQGTPSVPRDPWPSTSPLEAPELQLPPPPAPALGPPRRLRRQEVEVNAVCVLDISAGPAIAILGAGANPAFGCRLGRRMGAEAAFFAGFLSDLEASGRRWGRGVGGGLALRVAIKPDTLFGFYLRARFATAKVFYEFRDEVFVMPGVNFGYRTLFFDGRFSWDIGAGAQLLWEVQRRERTLSRVALPILYFRLGVPLPLTP